MFPKSDAGWVEEPLNLDKTDNFSIIDNKNIIQLEKIFYHIDSEDMAFRIKLNCLIVNHDSKIAENKTWRVAVTDSDSKNLLFSIQVNDSIEKSTIDLLDKRGSIRTSIDGKINEPEKEDDNIKIIIISSDDLNTEATSTFSFYLDFKFPNKLVYSHIPNLVGKNLNCNLSCFISNNK